MLFFDMIKRSSLNIKMKKKTLDHNFNLFIRGHLNPEKPVLIGLSGGPDSLALLYASLEMGLGIGLAHIDHGWREESADEAAQLAQLAKKLDLPFHMKKIRPQDLTGNLEEACRKERLNFFNELCQLYKYQAVMLGHHADDQSETVLKKILEGKSLAYLSGLWEKNEIRGLNIWRPFLNISKKSIQEWLAKRGLKGFEDRTNLDPKFLRGKFRTRIIPLLADEFGKEINQTLCRIGSEAQELKTYLDSQIDPYQQNVKKGAMGIFLDLHEDCPTKFEFKYLMRKLCADECFSLSYDLIETAWELIDSEAANRQIEMGPRKIYLDRGRIFIPNERNYEYPEKQHLEYGITRYGCWKIINEPYVGGEAHLPSKWEDVWGEGKAWAILPKRNYYLRKGASHLDYSGNSSLGDWWTKNKVPAFLRQVVPIIWSEGNVSHEFLTGRVDPKQKSKGESVKITLELE